MNFAGAILEAAPDAILVVEADEMVVLANRSAEELFGRAAGELVGVPMRVLVPDDEHGRRRDGTEFPAEIHRSALGPHEIAIVRDVSERRALETERLRSLQTVSDVALRALAPDALLEAVLDPVGAALDAPLVALSLRDPARGHDPRAGGARPAAAGHRHRVMLGEGIAGRIIADGAHRYADAQALVEGRWRGHRPDVDGRRPAGARRRHHRRARRRAARRPSARITRRCSSASPSGSRARSTRASCSRPRSRPQRHAARHPR